MAAVDCDEEELAPPAVLLAFADEDLKLLSIEEDDLVDSMSDPSDTPFPWKAVNAEADGYEGWDGCEDEEPGACVAVPLWAPPPKKLVMPLPLLPEPEEDDGCCCAWAGGEMAVALV